MNLPLKGSSIDTVISLSPGNSIKRTEKCENKKLSSCTRTEMFGTFLQHILDPYQSMQHQFGHATKGDKRDCTCIKGAEPQGEVSSHRLARTTVEEEMNEPYMLLN